MNNLYSSFLLYFQRFFPKKMSEASRIVIGNKETRMRPYWAELTMRHWVRVSSLVVSMAMLWY